MKSPIATSINQLEDYPLFKERLELLNTIPSLSSDNNPKEEPIEYFIQDYLYLIDSKRTKYINTKAST